jgi:hypothetical protein
VLGNKSGTQTNTFQVGFYFGSRVDTGTRIWHGEVSSATEYSYYFANGGINIDFDKGWRSDGAGIAAIYWRVGGSDSFGIANGTVDNNRGAYGSASSGAAVILDNQSTCGIVNFTSRNIKVEVNTTLTPGLGVFTLDDCPSAGNGEQFLLSFDTTWVAPASTSSAGFNFPSFVMSPANDKALVLSAANSQFGSGTGSNTTAAFVGIPALSRGNILGASGWTPLLTYSPSITSSGVGPSTSASPAQIFGDLNINQLWQYGIHASNLLYTDTAFAALPNGTTLYSGQIIAPPSYWNGANGKRYTLDVVYQTGTTGSPNGGATTCSGTSGTSVLTCTSATDLSAGELISIGTDTNKKISYVNATQPGAVLVNLTNNLNSAYSSQALSFSAPLLASEIQMPTKSSSAPTTLAWSQGDMEENSGAAANGIAAWVNVAAGTPGTWAAIPLGNSSGQIAASQIASGSLQGTDVKVLTAGTVSGTAVPLCTDANGGATTSGCSTATGIASANGLSTNASSQLVASTSHNLSVPANCVAASGSGTAYTCSTSPTFTPATGDHIQFKADVANTGSATLAVNGATGATIKKWGGTGNLIANDLLAGHWISATFNGTYWQLEGQLGNANATELNGTAITGLSGSGSVLALTSSPTFTGNTTTFANNSASTDYVVIQPGTSSTAELGGIQLNSAAATPVTEWYIEEDTSYDLKIRDQGATTPMDILTGYINAGTNINSQGASAVTINNASTGAGTGGFIVYEGGANYNTAAFTVTGSGNANVPGALTVTGTISGGMGASLSSATSIAATSFTSTGLALPAIPVSTTKRGMCVLIWEQNTAVGTVQFGMGTNNAPTDLWVINQDSPGTYKAPTYTTITSTATTAVSAADAPSATATGYRDEIEFTLVTGSSSAVTVTVYGLTSNTSDALVIEPGSYCSWLP